MLLRGLSAPAGTVVTVALLVEGFHSVCEAGQEGGNFMCVCVCVCFLWGGLLYTALSQYMLNFSAPRVCVTYKERNMAFMIFFLHD